MRKDITSQSVSHLADRGDDRGGCPPAPLTGGGNDTCIGDWWWEPLPPAPATVGGDESSAWARPYGNSTGFCLISNPLIN